MKYTIEERATMYAQLAEKQTFFDNRVNQVVGNFAYSHYLLGATEQQDIDIENAWQWMREHIQLIGCEMELHSQFKKAMKKE